MPDPVTTAPAIPGDPAALRRIADGWHHFADALDAASRDFGALDTEPWAGPAREAFTVHVGQTTPVWLRGADACRAAGAAVARYADVLEWARREAAGVAPGSPELTRVRDQVATEGDAAAAAVRGAGTPELTTLAAPPRPGNRWDNAPPGHPDPATISASKRRAHILWGDHENPEQASGGHHHDSGIPGKTVFPERWDSDEVIDNVEDVARDPDEEPVEQENGNWRVGGTRDGVDVVVIVDSDGDIVTAYPVGGEGVEKNDEEGEPRPLEPEPEPDGWVVVDPAEEDRRAEEAEDSAEESEREAEEHRERAQDAEDVGDQEAASEEAAAAEESRDESRLAEEQAEAHRRRADRADEADEASPWWRFR